MGAHMAALAEGMALAEKCDLDPLTLLEVRTYKPAKQSFLNLYKIFKKKRQFSEISGSRNWSKRITFSF